jgi:hypothetical protein
MLNFLAPSAEDSDGIVNVSEALEKVNTHLLLADRNWLQKCQNIPHAY